MCIFELFVNKAFYVCTYTMVKTYFSDRRGGKARGKEEKNKRETDP